MDIPEGTESEKDLSEGVEPIEEPVEEPEPKDPSLDFTEEQIKRAREKLSIPDKQTRLSGKQTNLSDEEALYNNRQSFLRFNRFKIHRNLITLSEIDQTIFLIILR